MEVENLTTDGTDQHVNSEEQESQNVEVHVAEESESQNVDGSISNEQAEADAYNDAWDNTDLDDDKVFDTVFSDTNDNSSETPAESPVDLLREETTQGTNNNIGAFMVDKPVLKYKGREIPIDNEAELINLAQKGFQMETEAANMKPHKKAIGIIDGVPLEVLQAVADIHSGNTNAIDYIKEKYGIKDTATSNEDNFWNDSDENAPAKNEETYTPNVKVDNPMQEFWDSYTANNQQGAGKVSDTYGMLEESFKAEIYNPEIFPAFVQSVETGEFDAAYPIALKEKSLNPAMTWIQAYGVAVSKIGQAPAKQTEPPASATPPSNSNQPRNVSETAKADKVWNDDTYFKELENKLFA